MQESMQFTPHLIPARKRIRMLLAERSALRAGAMAVLILIVLTILDKFRVIRLDWQYVLILIAVGLAGGWLWGFFRSLSDFDVARVLENRIGLRERLSSAVVLQSSAETNDMIPALVEDAAHHVAGTRLASLFPRRLNRSGHVFIGLLFLLLAVLILPELPVFQTQAKRKERETMRREGKQLEKLAKDVKKRQAPQDTRKIMKQIAANMDKLGKDMQTSRVTRKQALVKLNKLEKQVTQAEKQNGASKSPKPLAKASSQLMAGQKALAKMQADERAKVLAQLETAKKMNEKQMREGGKPLSEEQIKSLEKLAESLKKSQTQQLLNLDTDLASALAELLAKEDMQEALKLLEKLADKLQDEEALKQLSPEELKQLAEELKQLAEALKGTDLDALAKEMLEMAKALERGDLKKCKSCAGKMKKLCFGLGGKCKLKSLALALAQCRGGLQGGRGTSPGDGMAKYNSQSPHNINRQDPSRIPAKHYDTKIPGQIGEKGTAHSIQIIADPDKPGKAQVPYYKVYSDYSKAAEDALDREEVPAPYREKVKEYFESLNPDNK